MTPPAGSSPKPPRLPLTRVQFWLVLLVASSLAGGVFSWLAVPAAWLLGPLLVAGVLAQVAPARVMLDSRLIVLSQAALGIAISSTITPAALTIFQQYWLVIILAVVLLIAFSVLLALLLAYFSDLDVPTAILGTLPGGAPGMVAVSDELKTDTRHVAVMQTVRILVVLTIFGIVAAIVVDSTAAPPPAPPVPVDVPTMLVTAGVGVFGVLGGFLLRLPAPALVGPALLGAIVGVAGLPHTTLPAAVLLVAYLLIGVDVGLRFDVPAMQATGRMLPAYFITSLLMAVGAALLAIFISRITTIDLFSAYLATLPGGLNAVAIVAYESGASVTLVLTVNLLRFLAIVLVSPWLVRWLAVRFRRPAATVTVDRSGQQDREE